MPPKDPVTSSSALHDRHASPVSPTSFPFQEETTSSSAVDTNSLFLDVERRALFTPTVERPPQQQLLPTTFQLLPRSEQQQHSSETEIPVFLAFLNQLHGGEQHLAKEQPFPWNAAPASNKKAKTEQRRSVHFASKLEEVRSVVSRHELTPVEKRNTWYTEQYLRTKGQCEKEESAGQSLPASTLQRDLVLAGMYIRRGRKVVLTEQARHAYLSKSGKRKEDCIRDAYHKVTLHCQRLAKERGEAAAKVAAQLR
ncbi:hypothetical protein IV203_025979 [Nitzschia inconspicua]|uniref:Uncharacterized protein n=1 Tax=Nitzschia inconspicua TaxID=303405 RepID=A0A9K3LIN7_9STRA|nr:hypothetical protein IV203_025979 [Nitzschia inconspicua]